MVPGKNRRNVLCDQGSVEDEVTAVPMAWPTFCHHGMTTVLGKHRDVCAHPMAQV